MRKALLPVFYVIMNAFFLAGFDQPVFANNDPQPDHLISWIKNAGQFSDDIAFLKRTNAADIWVLKNRTIVYEISTPEGKRIHFEERIPNDASFGISPLGKQEEALKINYFGSSYRTGNNGLEATTFRQLDFGPVTEGAHLQLDARYGNIEKLLVVQAGTDPGLVRFELSGIEYMSIDDNGQLNMTAVGQKVSFTKPIAWQLDENGKKNLVDIAYLTDLSDGKFRYGFELSSYDLAKTLYIDPLLSSAYFGGNQKDVVQQIRTGSNHHVYVAGVTESPNLFSTGSYDNTYNGNMDIFAAVFSQDLTMLHRMTYLGGSKKDSLGAMVLDQNNRVYLSGTTASSNFPVTPNAYSTDFFDAQINISDMFVACLNDKLDQLISSTYLGSDKEDKAFALDINPQGQLFIAGMSEGKMPEVGPQWQTYTTGLVFAKMDADLENLLATNSIGEFGESRPTDIVVDSTGHVFATGYTRDAQFPVPPGGFSQNLTGKNDAFVLRVKNDLSQVLAGTYIGGFEDDYAYTLMVDTLQNVYLAGETRSSNFPVTVNAEDHTFTNELPLRSDAFICMMDSLLRTMKNSSFFGGSGNQAIFDISRDSLFNIVFAGYTGSGHIPSFCYSYDDTYNGFEDAFIGMYTEKLVQLEHTTFLGGSLNDRALCVEIGEKGFIYVGGTTTSYDFPYKNGYDGSYNGGERDGFLGLYSTLAKLEPCCSEPVFPQVFAQNQPTELTIRWTKAIGADGYFLSVGTAEGVFDLIYHEDVGLDTFYHLEDLPCGETIYVYVHPYNEFLTNIYCDYFTFSTIKPLIEIQDVDICQGESYFWRGQYYHQTGQFTVEVDNGNTCPDIYKLDLTVHKTYEFTAVHEICHGDTLFWQGDFYTQSVYLRKKYVTEFGCDSTYILDLWVFPAQSVFDTITLCYGDTISWNGHDYFEEGDYTCIKTDQYGCDVRHYLHLTVNTQFITTNTSICEGTFYVWHGQTYSVTGQYEFTGENEAGCDTTYLLNLFVEPYQYVYDTLTLCEWDCTCWHDIIVYEAGDYEYTEVDPDGCTTFHHLHLIIETRHIHEYAEICEGDSYNWFGEAYDVSGDYEHRIFMPVGCDTMHFLHLTVIPTVDVFDTLSICNLDIFCWHGVPIYEEGDFELLSEHEGSCDTLFHLNVSFYSEFMHFEEIALCEGDTLQWHGMEITGSGNYQWVDHSFESCDTIYHADVSLVEINNTVTTDGELIFAVFDPDATYQWVDCADLSPIPGAVSHFYAPDTCNTLFAVVIEKGGCSEISSCVCVEGTSVAEVSAGFFKVFPNPSDGRMRLLTNEESGGKYRLFVRDITGRIVYETELTGKESHLDISQLPAGTYILNAITSENNHQTKVVITR